jgi:hypothetical protein
MVYVSFKSEFNQAPFLLSREEMLYLIRYTIDNVKNTQPGERFKTIQTLIIRSSVGVADVCIYD